MLTGEDTGAFALPTGTVAFLLTDVEGSTSLWEAEPDRMAAAMERHRAILDATISARGGVCPAAQGEGDSVVAAFARPSDAVLAAREAQLALGAEPWPTSAPLRVRMAVHAGEARFVDDGNYAGQAIIRTARLRSIAHGGQVLVSAAARDLTVDQLGTEVDLIDLGEHRLRDLARPERVYQLGGPGLPGEFPRLLSLDAHPNNLPVELSTFIGRTAEIDAVARLVESCRLVTITGSGGAGKTRLAQRVAAEVLDGFADGAWWVELADLRDPLLLAASIAGAVGVKSDVGDGTVDGLADRLRGRRMLVVLDNCEHLVDAAASVVDRLLRLATGLTVLATSREPLTVDGEVTWRIPPLSAPAAGAQPPIELSALSQYDSVELFLDRARRARSNFRLAEDNAADVADICGRLDGIPLAIELAAARCRSLTPAQIRTALADAFRLLTGGGRAVLPRHQTLEASIKWSHDLLAPDEQLLFRRLAVFNGGCTLDDAEAVVGDGALARTAVLDVLDRLVAQSLVQLDDSRVVPRYRLLETVRLYATRQLDESGEGDAMRDAHGAHFLELAVEVGPRLEGSGDVAAFGRLAPELDNLRAALDSHAAAGRWDDHARLLGSLELLWVLAAPIDGLRRLTQNLDSGHRVASELRARLLLVRAYLLAYLADAVGSAADASSVLELTQDPRLRGRALAQVATATSYWDTPAADPLFEQAISECAVAGDGYGEAMARTFRAGVWSCLRSDMVRGHSLADEAAPLRAAHGGLYLSAYADALDAIACCVRGQYTEAAARSDSAERSLSTLAAAAGVEASVLTDDTFVGTCLLYARLWARLKLGGPDAVSSVSDLARHASAQGDVLTEQLLGLFECMRLRATGDLAGAIDECERLAETANSYGVGSFAANFWWLAADTARQRGDTDRAHELLERARGFSAESSPIYFQARLPLTRARLAVADGELGRADDLVHEALVLAERHRLLLEITVALSTLAKIETLSGDHIQAARFGGAAESVVREMRATCLIDDTLDELADDLAAARLALGDDAFHRAREEGRGLDVDEAIAFARRARGERRRPAFGWESLTPTEQLVVDEVAKGATNPEIAEQLLISRETVKTHLSHVFTKLGVKNRSELAASAASRRAAAG